MSENKKYCPSNGTEGMWFTGEFCEHCINEKFMHTQTNGDLQCNILDRTLLFDPDDKEYPEEWTYDDKGKPTCTSYKHWDWGRDGDDDGWNEPPPIYPDDPNQLCLPFIFDEIGIEKTENELVHD